MYRWLKLRPAESIILDMLLNAHPCGVDTTAFPVSQRSLAVHIHRIRRALLSNNVPLVVDTIRVVKGKTQNASTDKYIARKKDKWHDFENSFTKRS
jgi:hypothetical protein